MGVTNLPGLGTLLIGMTSLMAFVAFLLHAVAFAMPNWLVSVQPSPFDKIGFHRACFTMCYYPYCPGGEQFIYDGCWWIYDFYFREVSHWLRTDWFLLVRLLAIVNIPVLFIGFLLTAFATCMVGYWRYPRHKTPLRNNCLHMLMIIACLFLFASAIIMLFTAGIFAMNCFSQDWMPMPEKNALGTSFWLEITSVIVIIISVLSSICAVVFKCLGSNTPRECHVADDMMIGMDPLRY